MTVAPSPEPSPEDVKLAGERRRQLEEGRLSDHAYTQRRAMLLMAAMGFAISWGGIRLSAIEAVGLKITAWNERYLLGFAATLLAYLIGNFAALAQPAIFAWRADFDWFMLDANRAVSGAAEQVGQGAALLREVLRSATGAQATEVKTLIDKIDTAFKSEVPKRAKRYIGHYRSRLRFEYEVPVTVATAVLYLMILRLIFF
jgi:hypothetical protein